MAVGTQSRTVWKFKLAEEFVAVRAELNKDEFAAKIDRPLRDWTVLDDRPLPVCFFDTNVRSIINSSFSVLFDTPGVGQKKMAVLLRVLRRIAGMAEPATAGSASEPASSPIARYCPPYSRAAIDIQTELSARFQRLRHVLLQSGSHDVLARPLRYWATPSDRRLPTILLDNSVAELLEMPIAAMSDAPYVGPKKISALMDLLERAARAARSQGSAFDHSNEPDSQVRVSAVTDAGTDFVLNLTEDAWREWCDLVIEHGLADEPLGRFARSLGDLARVLWDVPLRRFIGLTLAELKMLDGRSPHRVRQVLGVFHSLQDLLKALGPRPDHLDTRVLPRIALRLSAWASLACEGRVDLSVTELNRELVTPLMSQLHVDLGDRAGRLSDWLHRFFAALGSVGDPQLQEPQAALLIKQQFLLHEAQTALEIRWPDGLSWMLRLHEHAERALCNSATIRAIDALIDLFFESPHQDFAGDPANAANSLNLSPRRWLAVGYRGPASSSANERTTAARWPHSRAAENNRTEPRRKQ